MSRSLHHGSTQELYTGLSLQADGKVAFEDIPVFDVCRPACDDSSLYLFALLVLFLEAVVLPQYTYGSLQHFLSAQLIVHSDSGSNLISHSPNNTTS